MSIPFASLSLSKYVNSAATDVGFASLFAVALLALLYFAGARETRTLRDQLDDAQDRINSLEARVAQALRNQARSSAPATTGQIPGVPGRPGVVAAPRVGPPPGAVVARVQREAGAGSPATAPAVGALALLGAPSGAGAPALGSATKLIPSPAPAPVPAPVPSAVPSAMPVTALGGAPAAYPELEDDEFTDDFAPEDTLYVPATTTAAANGRSGGGPAVAAPPRVQFRDEEPDGPPPRRTIPTVAGGPSGPRRVAGKLVGAVVALVALAVVVVALLLITSSSSSSKHHATRATVLSRTTPGAKKPKPKGKSTAFNPAKVKVSVLNGTAVAGLATDVAKMLSGSGYTVPSAAVTNAAIQTATVTTVGYLPGFKADALKVARALSKSSGVAVTTITPADSASVTSCATPVGSSGAAGSCPASVIVTVGTDLAGVANSAGASD
jgi:hypothetical protein